MYWHYLLVVCRGKCIHNLFNECSNFFRIKDYKSNLYSVFVIKLFTNTRMVLNLKRIIVKIFQRFFENADQNIRSKFLLTSNFNNNQCLVVFCQVSTDNKINKVIKLILIDSFISLSCLIDENAYFRPTISKEFCPRL